MTNRLKCSPDMPTEVCTEYRVDIVAVTAFFAAFWAAGFLMYGAITSQTTGEPLLIQYFMNYVVFTILLIGSGVAIVIAREKGLIRFNPIPRDKVTSEFDLADIGSTIGYGIVLAGLIGFVAFMVYGAGFLDTLELYSGTEPPGYIAVPVLIAPVMEEYNRGAFYSYMNLVIKGDGFAEGLLKSSVPALGFSFMHFWATSFSVQTILFTFGSGMVLGMIFWYTKKLGPSIGAHFTWNLIQLIHISR